MDGSAHSAIHTTNLQTPYALSIDYASQTLFWADSTLNKLESSSTDGTNRRPLNTNLGDPFAMAFFDGKLYWSDDGNDAIYSTRAVVQDSVTSVLLLGSDVNGLKVVNEDLQIAGTVIIGLITMMCIN